MVLLPHGINITLSVTRLPSNALSPPFNPLSKMAPSKGMSGYPNQQSQTFSRLLDPMLSNLAHPSHHIAIIPDKGGFPARYTLSRNIGIVILKPVVPSVILDEIHGHKIIAIIVPCVIWIVVKLGLAWGKIDSDAM